MNARSVTTGVSLVVAVVVLGAMAVWGYSAATAPVPSDETTASSGPTCPVEDRTVTKYVHRKDVTVSVFNSGKRSGRAQETMALLEAAGFKPGEVGNAPDGTATKRAVVYTTQADSPAAQLVALALGKKTEVERSDEELGPGVDVVIGDKFKALDRDAPKRIALPEPVVSCK